MTPLGRFLKDATPDERSRVASNAGTSVAYLYQLAGCHRKSTSASLAIALEQATFSVAAETDGRLKGVTAMQLATMCVAEAFEEL